LERVEEEERKSNRVGGDRPNGTQHDPAKQVPPLMIG
jgi:hypothetical protein